jgi:hypothetical protein
MDGRSAIAIAATAAALTVPASASAAGFSWTASSIGEAFGPGHTATVLRDGRLLYTGGSENYLVGGNLVCCRPVSHAFNVALPRRGDARISHMTMPRTLHHAVLLFDGRVLVVGGDASGVTSELWESDLGADNWARVGDLPAPVGAGAVAIALDNTKVLYAGGADSPSSSEPTARAALFDPITAFTWSPTGSLLTPRRDAAAARLPNGRILVSGGTGPGDTPLASAETFDPAAGTWSAVASMTTPRVGHVLVALDDGRVLAVAGNTGTSTEVYDPATDHWTATPAPADVGGRAVDSMALVHAVKLADGSVVAVDAVHAARFFPTRNAWNRLPDAPFGGHRYGSLTRTSDGRVLYAFGLSSSGANAAITAGADVLGPPVQLRILSANGNRVRYRVGEQGPTRFSLARKRHGHFARLHGRVARVTGAGTHDLDLNGRWRGHSLAAGVYRLKAVSSSRTELVASRPALAKFRIP